MGVKAVIFGEGGGEGGSGLIPGGGGKWLVGVKAVIPGGGGKGVVACGSQGCYSLGRGKGGSGVRESRLLFLGEGVMACGSQGCYFCGDGE